MKTRGLGGVRGLVTTNEGITYVVKPECLNQTLNEVMVQILLKSLGLDSIEYAFVKILDTHYGALKFIPGLKRIGEKNYYLLNRRQKIEYLKHLFINYFLNNEDITGEIYLDNGGKVVSLDYGDAGVSIALKGIDKLGQVEKDIVIATLTKKKNLASFTSRIKSYIDYALKHFSDDIISINEIRVIIVSMLKGIVDSDYIEFGQFLKDLMLLHSELHAYIYQEHMNELIDAAEEIRKNLDNIWKDMLTE